MSSARDLVNQLNSDRARIKSLRLRIEELKKDDGYASFDYSQTRVQTSPNGTSPQERIAARVEELTNELADATMAYTNHKDKLERASKELGGLQGDYIFLRYVCNWRPERIADMLHYSVRYLANIDMVAVREMDRRRLCD